MIFFPIILFLLPKQKDDLFPEVCELGLEMAADRVRCGYPRVSIFRIWCWFFAHGFQVRIWVWFRVLVSTRGYPMDIGNKLFGIKTHVL